MQTLKAIGAVCATILTAAILIGGFTWLLIDWARGRS